MNVLLRGCDVRGAENSEKKRVTPEHLPFTISRNGPVDMQRWKNELARGDEQVAQLAAKAAALASDASDHTLRRAQFHGRQLQGRALSLAPGVGYVVREEGEKEVGGARVKDFRALQWFDKVGYWNHDTPPSEVDWFPKVMQWQKDAPVLHGQVTDDEFSAAEAAMASRRAAAGGAVA